MAMRVYVWTPGVESATHRKLKPSGSVINAANTNKTNNMGLFFNLPPLSNTTKRRVRTRPKIAKPSENVTFPMLPMLSLPFRIVEKFL
jgi:hypothetical protein